MSLEYFYGLTQLGTGIVRDQWDYNASAGLGNFTANSSANTTTRVVSGLNYDNFSLFFAYKKQKSTFNNKGVSFFSNISGTNGFDFGLDAGNFPYLKTNEECYTFDKINLGGKNIICFQKSNNLFSVLNYNLPSYGITSTQSTVINPSTNLNGTGYRFGGYTPTVSGINNFYGEVDQLLFLSEKVSQENSLTIFSGFSNLTVVEDIWGTYEVESSEWFISNTGFTPGMQSGLQDYFTGVYQNYVSGENLQEGLDYLGRITFSGHYGGFTTKNYYGLSQLGFCQTGASTQMGGPDEFTFAETGLFPTDFTVNVNFTIGPLDEEISAYQPQEMYFTYDLSEIYLGLRFNDLWTLVLEDSVVETSNTGYFLGFEMNGIVAPNSDQVVFGTVPGSFDQVGKEAIFDSTLGVFFGSGASTGIPIYLNGLQITGFTIVDGTIDVLGYNETSSDSLIYDEVSGIQLIALANSSKATGDYWPGTAFVATGDFSFEPLYRLQESSFLETHRYHLYHNKQYATSSASGIFNNIDENWN